VRPAGVEVSARNAGNQTCALGAAHTDAYINLRLEVGRRREGFCSLVRLAGIEPTTLGFGGQYSIH
jgi:hypothetical protein